MFIGFISPEGKNFENSGSNVFETIPELMHNLGPFWKGLSPGLLILAALTPSHHKMEIIDENIEPVDFNKPYDLVAITFMTQQATRAYEIADTFRAKGVKVVLGGIHASVLPEEAMPHAGSVIAGEAEYLWPVFLDDAAKGREKKLYRSEMPVDLKDSPLPRYDLIKDKNYLNLWVQTTRGCSHDCEFCAASTIYGKKYRKKEITQVLGEIDFIQANFAPGYTLTFSDDNFLVDVDYSEELLKALIKKDIRYFAQSDIAVADQDRLLPLLRKSGCIHLFIGFESLSTENLRGLDKGNWKAKQREFHEERIEKLQSNGIAIMGSFIVGLDHDDESTFRELKDFIIRNRIWTSHISVMTPLPGTRLRKRLETENRILPTPWRNYTYFDVNFIHKTLSKQQIEEDMIDILQAVNNKDMLAKRLGYFKEVYRKLRRKED